MNFKNIMLYFVALIMMALGISLYLKANVGVGSWDVLHSNLVNLVPAFSYGTWVMFVGIATITFSLLFKFTLKSYFSIITGIINGLFIDLFNYLLSLDLFTLVPNLVIHLLVFFIGLLFLGSGISLLVLTKLPPTPPDIFMLSLMHRFKLNFTISKTISEMFVLIVAVVISILGGFPFYRIGLGTILTTMFVGLIVGYSSKKWRKMLKLTIDN